MAGDKTKKVHVPVWSNAWGVVGSLWGVILLLSLYGAPALRDEVSKNESLSQQPWLVDGVTGLMKFSDAIGVTALREGLGKIRSAINAPYTILEEEEVDIPLPPQKPDAGPSVADAGLPDEAIVHYSAQAKKRVLVVGASSIQFAIGTELERRIPKYPGVKVRRYGKLATGLSRPDFFDWPKKIKSLAHKFRPDLIIANFGGNGAQGIPMGKYKEAKYPSPEWDVEYAKRVKQVVDIGKAFGADTVFIGMPNMRSAKFANKMRKLNKVQKKAAEDNGAVWISTWAMASMPNGTYRKSIKYGKRRGLMRTSDGVHYTKLGAKFVIDNVMEEIERHFNLGQLDEGRADCVRSGLQSKLLKRRVDYLAYVPRGKEKAPVLFVLPGAKSKWDRWPNHPHRRLQRFAQDKGVVVIVPEMSDLKWYVDGPEMEYARHFVEELLVDVKEHFSVSDRVGIAGQGTGGHAAMYFAASLPDQIVSASSTGGWLDLSKVAEDKTLVARLGDHASNPEAWSAVSPIELLDLGKVKLQLALAGNEADTTLAPFAKALADKGITADVVSDKAPWSKALEAALEFHATQLAVAPAAP